MSSALGIELVSADSFGFEGARVSTEMVDAELAAAINAIDTAHTPEQNATLNSIRAFKGNGHCDTDLTEWIEP